MFKRQDIDVRLELPARVEILWPLDAFLVELLSRYRSDLPRKALDDISLIVHEAFTNICMHAYQPEDEGVVWVRIKLAGPLIELTFEDTGESFDEKLWKAPDLSEPLESGMGVWLMKQLSNEFTYRSGIRGPNQLILVKHLEVEVQGAGSSQ